MIVNLSIKVQRMMYGRHNRTRCRPPSRVVSLKEVMKWSEAQFAVQQHTCPAVTASAVTRFQMMIKLACSFIVPSQIALLLIATSFAPGAQTSLYVAPSGNDHWSGRR